MTGKIVAGKRGLRSVVQQRDIEVAVSERRWVWIESIDLTNTTGIIMARGVVKIIPEVVFDFQLHDLLVRGAIVSAGAVHSHHRVDGAVTVAFIVRPRRVEGGVFIQEKVFVCKTLVHFMAPAVVFVSFFAQGFVDSPLVVYYLFIGNAVQNGVAFDGELYGVCPEECFIVVGGEILVQVFPVGVLVEGKVVPVGDVGFVTLGQQSDQQNGYGK